MELPNGMTEEQFKKLFQTSIKRNQLYLSLLDKDKKGEALDTVSGSIVELLEHWLPDAFFDNEELLQEIKQDIEDIIEGIIETVKGELTNAGTR